MNPFTSIPVLTRNGQLFTANEPIGQQWDHDINTIFERYATSNNPEAINPLLLNQQSREEEHYDVEAVVPAREGALSLGMPVLRKRPEPTPTTSTTHMGYIPITEEEAFQNPVSEDTLQASRFTIPRGQRSANQIITHIRKVVFATDDIHEIAPKDTHSTQSVEPDRMLYSSTLLYATFDQYGNHRFAQFNIRLQPVKDQDAESIAIVVTHFQGDTRLSMEFFLTVRAYVLSNGTAEYKVRTPDLFNGFADEYLDVMSEPTTIEFSSSEE